MKSIDEQLVVAERLHAVTQRIGFTLWQIQELEHSAAQYFVLVARAQKGMGSEAGNELLNKALGKTFGATIQAMSKAQLLSAELEQRFRWLLLERNWLVHSSRSTNRNAIYSDETALAFIEKLDGMTDQSDYLMKQVLQLVEQHVKKHGVTQQQVEAAAVKLIDQWHGPATI